MFGGLRDLIDGDNEALVPLFSRYALGFALFPCGPVLSVIVRHSVIIRYYPLLSGLPYSYPVGDPGSGARAHTHTHTTGVPNAERAGIDCDQLYSDPRCSLILQTCRRRWFRPQGLSIPPPPNPPLITPQPPSIHPPHFPPPYIRLPSLPPSLAKFIGI